MKCDSNNARWCILSLRCSFLVTMLFLPLIAFSQEYRHEIPTIPRESTTSFDFGSGINEPIQVRDDVDERKSVRIIATNSTFYPFTIRIIFSNIRNLSPAPSFCEPVITHGTHTVHTMNVVYPEQLYSYNFSYSYKIGYHKSNPERNYVYLVPLKPGTLPEAYSFNNYTTLHTFMVRCGDTIYCSRKGTLTAVPEDHPGEYRISGNDAFEVLHDDGTLMIYNNIKRNSLKLFAGSVVLPGDPIAVVQEDTFVRLQLIWLTASDSPQVMPILYAAGDTLGVQYERLAGRLRVVHPGELIEKEMTKRELKLKTKKLSAE